MRRVKYKGEPCTLGTFGECKKGRVLLMTEQQIETIASDTKRFQIMDKLEEPDWYIVPVGIVGSRWRDLRLAQWFRGGKVKANLWKYLRSTPRSRLLNWLEGMRLIGLNISDDVGKDSPLDYIVNEIYREALLHEWHLTTVYGNKQNGVFDPDDESTHEVQYAVEEEEVDGEEETEQTDQSQARTRARNRT